MLTNIINSATVVGAPSRPSLGQSRRLVSYVQSMADADADPALVYAFQKTAVFICEENEKRLPASSLKAFDGAVEEYRAALKRPRQ